MRSLADKKIRKGATKNDVALSDHLITDPRKIKAHASLIILSKDVAEILVTNFPGWLWAVQPDQDGMVINIFNHHLHDEWGYTIRTVEIHNDPKRRLAYTAGREILTRFGLEPRGLGAQKDTYAMLKRDAKGKVIPVHARDRMTRQQLEQESIKETAEKIRNMVKERTDERKSTA